MLSRIKSYGLIGLNGYAVTVEIDVSGGMPAYETVGLPDAAVRESKERVRAAMSACRMQFPVARLTLNLAPADVRKEGPAYDLPIALAILSAMGRLPGEAEQDGEGRQTMRTLARNMTFLMKSIALGKEQFGLPEKEERIATHFIR